MVARSYTTSHNEAADIVGPRLVLLLSVLALTLIGFVMVYSASSITALSESQDAASYLFDQIKFALFGVGLALLLWKVIPYRVWSGKLTVVVWAIGCLLLVLTAVMGTSMNGAKRWISFGSVGFQPSEFMKIALVLMAASIMSDLRAGILDGRQALVKAFVFIIIPTGFLFFTQSDLGTTAIILLGVIAVMWLGEVDWRVIAGIIVLVLLFAIAATVFSSYRSNRMLYLNPWNDGENGYGNGYQIIHSYYAFSEGGIFGVGLGNSREKYLYLPESETDFIFAIIGEEFGMVGALVVIGLFLAFLWASLRIARSAYDDFGCMMAGSLGIMIAFQAFLNIGCTIGVFPTTGKPLPFISSGGSSLIASYIMVGLILAVSKDAGGESIYKGRRDNLRVVRAVRNDDDYGDAGFDVGRYGPRRSVGTSFSSSRTTSGQLSGRTTPKTSLIDGFPTGNPRRR